MFGFGSFAEFAFADIGYTSTPPTPIVVIDAHDGDEKRKKRYAEENAAKERKKAELKAIYEELVEGKRPVQEIVAPFTVVTESNTHANFTLPVVDFDRVLDSLETVNALYRELQELDDEEVLLLL
jgi:hypothetical protein